jgi:hypothetical protein
MRLLTTILTLALVVSLLGLVLENLGTRADVTVWRTTYPDVPLYLVTILSVFVGIVYAGVIAVAEGAHIRLANRRLARDVRKLETELNFLRTEPPAPARREPDDLPGVAASPKKVSTGTSGDEQPASAPVYSPKPKDWPAGDDDDTYSGGRAV